MASTRLPVGRSSRESVLRAECLALRGRSPAECVGIEWCEGSRRKYTATECQSGLTYYGVAATVLTVEMAPNGYPRQGQSSELAIRRVVWGLRLPPPTAPPTREPRDPSRRPPL